MNQRLLQLRKDLNISQEQFGQTLGVTRSSVSNMETGRFSITDTMVKLICSTYKVNEEWLRTGDGIMYLQFDESEKEDEFIAKFMKDKNELKKGIIMDMYDMDDHFWELTIGMIKKYASKE